MTAQRRLPTEADLEALVRVLNKHHVEYAVIGGTAMMFHGFARATKDVDLLLPLSPQNNARLRAALAELPFNKQALEQLEVASLDKGFSTAVEGEIVIDLLFVANSLTFEDLRQYLEKKRFGEYEVTTFNIEGLIKTKETNRDSDKSDVGKLRRLRIALLDEQRQTRKRKPRK